MKVAFYLLMIHYLHPVGLAQSYYMLKALSKRNISIEILGPVNSYMIYMLKVYKLILRCFGKEYDYSHSKLLSRYYGRIFGRKLKN